MKLTRFKWMSTWLWQAVQSVSLRVLSVFTRRGADYWRRYRGKNLWCKRMRAFKKQPGYGTWLGRRCELHSCIEWMEYLLLRRTMLFQRRFKRREIWKSIIVICSCSRWMRSWLCFRLVLLAWCLMRRMSVSSVLRSTTHLESNQSVCPVLVKLNTNNSICISAQLWINCASLVLCLRSFSMIRSATLPVFLGGAWKPPELYYFRQLSHLPQLWLSHYSVRFFGYFSCSVVGWFRHQNSFAQRK